MSLVFGKLPIVSGNGEPSVLLAVAIAGAATEVLTPDGYLFELHLWATRRDGRGREERNQTSKRKKKCNSEEKRKERRGNER
jgi:hypothetical protein